MPRKKEDPITYGASVIVGVLCFAFFFYVLYLVIPALAGQNFWTIVIVLFVVCALFLPRQ
jgi:hypothetical protein